MKNSRIAELSLLFFALIILTAGCTHTIPLSMNLQIQKPLERKIPKKVLVIMNKELAEMVIQHKPGAFSDTLAFAAGESIAANLMTAMKAMFETIDFANEFPAGPAAYDYYLMVKLRDHKFDWGSHAFSDWKYNVNIDYELLDPLRKTLLAVPTKGRSQNQITGAERDSIIATGIAVWVLTPIAPIAAVSGAGRGYSVMGRTWDEALADSITQLMNSLDRYFRQSLQK
jgi:hypothetical protein